MEFWFWGEKVGESDLKIENENRKRQQLIENSIQYSNCILLYSYWTVNYNMIIIVMFQLFFNIIVPPSFMLALPSVFCTIILLYLVTFLARILEWLLICYGFNRVIPLILFLLLASYMCPLVFTFVYCAMVTFVAMIKELEEDNND